MEGKSCYLLVSMLSKYILVEASRALKSQQLDWSVLRRLNTRLLHGDLIRDENPEDHFCVFVVPFNKKSGQVFLGNHKKANDWIPPGGHIEKNETPLEAAIREACEELSVDVVPDQLKLFTIDNLNVARPNAICKIHWHIWYLLETNLTNYRFDTGEFYDAGWFTIKNAVQKIRIDLYRKTIKTLLYD